MTTTPFASTRDKLVDAGAAADRARQAQAAGHKVVFTNGCFDLLHLGHVRLLEQARALGQMLIVGLNSDQGVRSLGKGPERPIRDQAQRAEILAALAAVDLVVIFDEPTPLALVEQIQPDVLVKGGDWPPEKMVGAQVVRARGGQVVSLPLVPGHSTSQLLERLRRGGP